MLITTWTDAFDIDTIDGHAETRTGQNAGGADINE